MSTEEIRDKATSAEQEEEMCIRDRSDKYIKHPLDVVSVGDTVKVKIISIDHEKMKIGLTMKL